MPTRTITYTLTKPDGDPWASFPTAWRLMDSFATSTETVGSGETVISTADSGGDGSVSLRVPDDGAVWYMVGLPGGDVSIQIADGATTTLEALLLDTQTLPSPSALATHAATKASAGALGHVRVGTGLSIDSNGILSTIGAAPTGSAGGDLAGSYPNPTVATDAITFAKMQNVSSQVILGRNTASAGDIEALTGDTILSIIGAQLASNEGRAVSGGGTTYLTIPGVIAFNGSTMGITAGRAYFMPFRVRKQCTVSAASCEVTSTGAGGTIGHLYIYNLDTNRQATSRVLDMGTVAVDTLGVKSITSLAQSLTPGMYCTAFISNGAPTMRTIRGSLTNTDYITTLGSSMIPTDMRVDVGGSTIADPAPAWTATNAAAGGLNHVIFLTIASFP